MSGKAVARAGRGERGAVTPSPVILFSIVVIAVAAVTFFLTRDQEPAERDITDASASDTAGGTDTSPSDSGATEPASGDPSAGESDVTEPADEPSETRTRTPKPIDRASVGVVVFNNTTISGLASEVMVQVEDVGWDGQYVDNWYGTIPDTTVYFPEGMKREGRQLALDLGVDRILPADLESDMSTENLTLILTDALS